MRNGISNWKFIILSNYVIPPRNFGELFAGNGKLRSGCELWQGLGERVAPSSLLQLFPLKTFLTFLFFPLGLYFVVFRSYSGSTFRNFSWPSSQEAIWDEDMEPCLTVCKANLPSLLSLWPLKTLSPKKYLHVCRCISLLYTSSGGYINQKGI